MSKPTTNRTKLTHLPLLVRIGEAEDIFGISRHRLMQMVREGKVAANTRWMRNPAHTSRGRHNEGARYAIYLCLLYLLAKNDTVRNECP
jgi:hypothetical protein